MTETMAAEGGGEPIKAEIILYQSEGANVPVQVRYMGETLWLTQAQMAELFDVDRTVISRHLKNIFESGELERESTCAKIAHVGSNGQTYQTDHFSLDAIIAVGYRVNSLRATRFRQWATSTLREYITKGFVLNDDMLKNGAPFGKDYFDELLARIRDIRASERRFWLKITDYFEECCLDYDGNSDTARRFYASIQNKMHYATTGHTAAELVHARADASLPNMGLTTWKGGPEGRIHSSDVDTAKNYLTQTEMRDLDRLASMFLDVVEDRAERHQITTMAECVQLGRNVLSGKGTRLHAQARRRALDEFAKFQRVQDASYENDFEKEVKRIEGRGNYVG